VPNEPPAKLVQLQHVAKRLARLEATRAALAAERDQLIREVMANGQGATTVARASGMSTAAVYKIRDKAPA
jgi:DNA invertase Pin-like site-specific DNA recombinase